MKQVLQNLKTGQVDVADVPAPLVRPGHLLIQTHATLISAGTERMLVEFGKGSLIAKARSQPDKVKQVLDKIRTEGLLPTLEAVFARLDEPLPLGYCNVGSVLEIGASVDGFSVGDRVVSNGPHAEIVCVPVNLCAETRDNVPDDQAAFTVLSSIALQGIRLLNPTLGERIVVTGLGLIGLVAVQLLRANGCAVLGIDPDGRKRELAERFGARTFDVSNGADPTPAAIAFSGGRGDVMGSHVGRKFGFEQTTTDYRDLLSDDQINAIVITTRHNLHAGMTVEALEAGKHVFVEKPLALNDDDLQRVQSAFDAAGDRLVMVGFNRRFSPHVERIKKCIAGRSEPLCMIMTVNAGYIPPDHWTQDPEVGGGRVIGEGCHWFDLMAYLAESPIVSVQAVPVGAWSGPGKPDDKVSVMLSFVDGSIGTLHYFANGVRSFPKERLDVFCAGGVLCLDNFRTLRGFGVRGLRKFKTSRPDKGHRAEVAAFVDRIGRGGAPLIPFDQLVNVTRATFAAVQSASERRPVNPDRPNPTDS